MKRGKRFGKEPGFVQKIQAQNTIPLIAGDMMENNTSDIINAIKFMPNNICGHKYQDPFSGFSMRVVSDFELIYYIGGKGFITIEDSKFVCKKGDVIFICPHEKHMISTDKNNPQNNYFVHFDVRPFYFKNSLAELLSTEKERIIQIGYNKGLMEFFASIVKEIKEKKEGYINVASGYLSVLVFNILRSAGLSILESEKTNTIKQDFQGLKYIKKAEQFIREHYRERISVKDISTHLFVSDSYLYKLFQNYLNISPVKYVTKLRMEHAEYLIKRKIFMIKEIASLTGYTDIYYFSNAFKKKHGCSPSSYAKLD